MKCLTSMLAIGLVFSAMSTKAHASSVVCENGTSDSQHRIQMQDVGSGQASVNQSRGELTVNSRKFTIGLTQQTLQHPTINGFRMHVLEVQTLVADTIVSSSVTWTSNDVDQHLATLKVNGSAGETELRCYVR